MLFVRIHVSYMDPTFRAIYLQWSIQAMSLLCSIIAMSHIGVHNLDIIPLTLSRVVR